jgi:TfoX/Sxy family transcriptional regulator of competence genes
MSTSPETVAFLEEQLAGLPIRIAPMFGEYGIWFDDKPLGVIARDTLYLKRSDADPALLEGTTLEPAYDGARPSHAVPRGRAEDVEWLTAAVRATAAALPEPKRRKKPSA